LTSGFRFTAVEIGDANSAYASSAGSRAVFGDRSNIIAWEYRTPASSKYETQTKKNAEASIDVESNRADDP